MWLIRVTPTRTLLGFSLRMPATYTSFSTTNAAQLLVPIPLFFLFCFASEIVSGTVGCRAGLCRCLKHKQRRGQKQWWQRLFNERDIGLKERAKVRGRNKTKHKFDPAIKATACAGDLHPDTFVQTIPCVLYLPLLKPMPSHFCFFPYCQRCKTIPY